MVLQEKLLKTLLSVAFLVSLVINASEAFCGKLGSFDALCMKNDTVFILSISPCHHEKSLHIERTVFLTIIDTRKRMKKYDIKAVKPIRKPLSFGRDDVGVLLDFHYHSGGRNKGHLHVDFGLGNFLDGGINTKMTLLDIYFYIENAGFCGVGEGFSGASFYPAPACQMSKRTGNLSTLCITNPSSSMDKSSQGIFLISVDPCSIPISYWAVALFPAKNNTQIIKQYTASKTDLFVPVESHSCGFKVRYSHDLKDTLTVKIEMSYGCSDATAVQLINDYYFPQTALMCPHKGCKSLAPQRRLCSTSMIVAEQKSVNLTLNLTLSGCEEMYNVDAVIAMDGNAKKLELSFVHEEQVHEFIFDDRNRSKGKHQAMQPITSGFIPSSGGYLNVMFERTHLSYDDYGETGRKKSHVEMTSSYLVIDRIFNDLHSPQHLLIPLVYEEFPLPRCNGREPFRGFASLSGGVIAVISLSVIAVVAAVIGFAIYRRRKLSKNGDGLPYQIELNYDCEQENDFRDDL